MRFDRHCGYLKTLLSVFVSDRYRDVISDIDRIDIGDIGTALASTTWVIFGILKKDVAALAGPLIKWTEERTYISSYSKASIFLEVKSVSLKHFHVVRIGSIFPTCATCCAVPHPCVVPDT